MKPEYILDADLLDIIFENKNKNYGAYSLRKNYNERLYKALGIIFFGAMVLALAGILYKNKIITAPVIPDLWVGTTPIELPIDKPKPTEPPKHSTAPVAPTTDQKPTVNNASSTKILISQEGEKIHEPTPDGGIVSPGNISPGDAPVGGGESKFPVPASGGSETANTIDKSMPQAADIMPSFPGGIEALKKFLKKNLVTPKDMDREETVSVKVQFVVGYDGELKGFRIIEDGGAVFNEEVISVLKKMPSWIPGKAHGENVSVYYTIPVMFTSEE